MLPRKTHLEMASALRLVKSVLSDHENVRHTYVCLTIDHLVRCRKIKIEISDHLQKWIVLQLDGDFSTVKTWATEQGIYLDDYQAYRKAWIDHMIKILES